MKIEKLLKQVWGKVLKKSFPRFAHYNNRIKHVTKAWKEYGSAVALPRRILPPKNLLIKVISQRISKSNSERSEEIYSSAWRHCLEEGCSLDTPQTWPSLDLVWRLMHCCGKRPE